jgi:TonB family protein
VRSNLNTVAKHAGTYFCWEVSDEGVVVRFHLNLLDLLEQEAIHAGGTTAAGVLIGQTENGRSLALTVESYEAIAPEPEASKSPFGNHRRMAEIVDRWRPGRKRISILGFYRTSTREDEVLDKEDLAALCTGISAPEVYPSDRKNSNREHPEGLGKQREHPNAQTVTADDADASLDESAYSSLAAKSLIGSSSVQPERIFLLIGTCPGRISHATLYFVRNGTIVSYSSYTPRVAFSSAELCKQQAPSEAKSLELCAAPFETEDAEIVSDEQKFRLQTIRKYGMAINWRWLTASALMAVVCALLFYTGRKQHSDALAHREKSSDFHLGLKLARSGTDWELSWDQDAPVLLGAANGHLRITDGVIQKNLDLAPSELRTGRIMYTPATNDVVMQLEVESGKSEKPVSESVRIVAGPSPSISASRARTTAPLQAIRDESRWPAVVAAPPALAVRPSYKGSPTPSAMAGPLPGTFVKSQKPQSSTERISAATDQPLDEPPSLGAPPMLSGTPTVMASKQASPPAALDPAASVPLMGGKVEPAQLISRRDPVYPPAAKLANISGTVEAHFKIGPNGEVRDVTATKGNPALMRAAIDAVREWRYTPARLNGVPVEAQGTAVVAFKLN